MAPAAAYEGDAVAVLLYFKGDALDAQRGGAEVIAAALAEAGAAAVGVSELYADDVAGVGVGQLNLVRRGDGEAEGVRLCGQSPGA